MKILSKSDLDSCYCYLYFAKYLLLQCKQKMKGKYGTSGIVLDLNSALRDINVALSYYTKYKYWSKYKYPPNTPKSRRLGWYPDGGGDAEK